MSESMEEEMAGEVKFATDIAAIPQIARGQVWCTTCGRTEKVNGSAAMRNGWPKCCGYTMTIDSPEERAALSKASSK